MIQVTIKTATSRKTKNVDVNSTPKQILDESQIQTDGVMVSLNGSVLTNTMLNSSFSDLGVAEDSTCYLSAIVKADGANI